MPDTFDGFLSLSQSLSFVVIHPKMVFASLRDTLIINDIMQSYIFMVCVRCMNMKHSGGICILSASGIFALNGIS